MKIKRDDKHTLNSDRFQFWITEHYVAKNGKEFDKRVSGYHAPIKDCVQGYLYGAIQKKWPFDMLVVDELSAFKNSNSQRFRALKKSYKFGLCETFYRVDRNAPATKF